jgi:hypothetical protein
MVDLTKFFPTSQARIRRLLQTMKLDWKSRDELYEEMLSILSDEIRRAEYKKVESTKLIAANRATHEVASEQLNTMRRSKHPDRDIRLPAMKERMVALKEEHHNLICDRRDAETRAKRLRENLTYIQEGKKPWW